MKMCMVLPKYDAARSATQLCLTTNSHSAVGEKTSADAHRQSSFLYVGGGGARDCIPLSAFHLRR